MISFDNTAVAFLNKTNKELWKTKLLFRLFASQKRVFITKKLLSIGSFLHIPFDWIIKPTIYRLFVGGQSYNDCLPYVRLLSQQNIKSALQYSADSSKNGNSRDEFFSELKSLINNAKSTPELFFIVFKPSNLINKEILTKVSQGEDLKESDKVEFDKFKERIDELCSEVSAAQKRLIIDAEESWYQPIVDSIALEMMQKYNTQQCIVYSTLQLYRTDRLQFLFNIHNQAKQNGFILGVKLVRGAYMEIERKRAEKMGYTSPIHESKSDTDRDFNEAIKYVAYNVETISMICATHNEDSVNYLACLMDADGIDNNDQRIFFSQLYGMSDFISFNLSLNDYNVVKLIPYGPPKLVLSYLIRRAEENTALQGQTTRELSIINLELNRRKLSQRANKTVEQ